MWEGWDDIFAKQRHVVGVDIDEIVVTLRHASGHIKFPKVRQRILHKNQRVRKLARVFIHRRGFFVMNSHLYSTAHAISSILHDI